MVGFAWGLPITDQDETCLSQTRVGIACYRPGCGLHVTDQVGACLLQTRVGPASYRPVWGLPVTDQCGCWPVTDQGGASPAVIPMLIFINIQHSYNCLGHTMGDG